LAIYGWTSAYLPFAVKYPRLRMPLHADAWIVVDGFWGGQQNDRTAVSEFRLCPGYEFPADALPLEITVNGKVGKVAAVVKVRDGPGNAHKGIFIPCGNSQIPVLQHSGNARRIIHRPPLCQAGSLENINELPWGYLRVYSVLQHFILDLLFRMNTAAGCGCAPILFQPWGLKGKAMERNGGRVDQGQPQQFKGHYLPDRPGIVDDDRAFDRAATNASTDR
jgi:hypothetical protein